MFVQRQNCSVQSGSDEAATDVGAPPPLWWLAHPQVERRRHPVGVAQWAQRVIAGAGQEAMRQDRPLVVLAANDARHQWKGGGVGQQVAGVPVEGG